MSALIFSSVCNESEAVQQLSNCKYLPSELLGELVEIIWKNLV